MAAESLSDFEDDLGDYTLRIAGDVLGLPPTRKAQCKKGGWRELADDAIEVFRNQGACVSYVVSRRP